MLALSVSVDGQSGFCFGVVYAVQMAEDILRAEGKLYCLGDIVHNDEEVQRLKDLGLVIINHDELTELRDAKVLIRAHGEPPSTYMTALENNIELVDASCPVVLKLQQRVKAGYDKGENVFILGKHGHAEVIGLQGQTNNTALVFENIEELETVELPQRVNLYSQTTKSVNKLFKAGEYLRSRGVDVTLNDTICRQVSNRDGQLKAFAQKFDAVVFVAGNKSSNGKVLHDACKSVNARTHFITNPSELQPRWFNNGERVGVCGATSTPMWLMEAVREELLTS